MKYKKDLSGQTKNGITLISRIINPSIERIYYSARCKCGTVFKISSNCFINGKGTGCSNCFAKTRITHNMTGTKIYKTWTSMKERCYRKNGAAYPSYGGRGIEVCSEWKNDFASFHNWSLKNGYKEGLTIDRINNDGNYEPSNCRWTDYITQNNNTRNNVKITINGITKTIAQWAYEYKANIVRARSRIRMGWPPIKAFTLPSKKTIK